MSFFNLFTSKKEAVLKTDALRSKTKEAVEETKVALEHKATDLSALVSSTLLELRLRNEVRSGIHPKHKT